QAPLAIHRQPKRSTSSLSDDEVLIIDTPPGDEPSITPTLQVSDFIISPAAPRGADVAQMWKVIDVLKQTPYAALLTQVRAGTTAISEALDALKEADVSFFETVIPLREAFHRSFRTKPTDLGE